MERDTSADDPDVFAIKQLMRRELSLSWSRDKDGDWEAFANAFVPGAALFPAARPAKLQTLDQFVERMEQLRADGKLHSFEVTPLGCDVQVFGKVAVALAACRLLENGSIINYEVNATVLVHEVDSWRIAAQAWDVESSSHTIPDRLLRVSQE